MSKQLKELIKKEMLILLRDKQTILLLFLMPVALIFFLSLAMEGVWADKLTGRKIQLVIENESNSPKANLLEEKIKSNKLIEEVNRPTGMDDDKIFAEGKAHAIVTIPKGFDEGEKPVEMYFDPVIDAGYKIATRSLITSLTVEVVMGIDNLEAVVADLVTEKKKTQQRISHPSSAKCSGLRDICDVFYCHSHVRRFFKRKKRRYSPASFYVSGQHQFSDPGENCSLLYDQCFPVYFNDAGGCLCDVPYHQFFVSTG